MAFHTAPVVYVVDDDPLVLAFADEVLAREGYRTARFGDAEAVVHAARTAPPALFMLDIRMPGVDGVELLKHLRRIDAYRATPVLMLTGGGRLDRVVLAMSAGADAYLMKPFTAEQMLAKIQELLGDRGPA